MVDYFDICLQIQGPCLFNRCNRYSKKRHCKLITLKDSGHKITALYDEGWDSLKGGAYLFYPNQLLKSYTFYQNRVAVYMESYDESWLSDRNKGQSDGGSRSSMIWEMIPLMCRFIFSVR